MCCCSSLVFAIFDACYNAVVIVDGNNGCCVIVPHRANFIEVITPEVVFPTTSLCIMIIRFWGCKSPDRPHINMADAS